MSDVADSIPPDDDAPDREAQRSAIPRPASDDDDARDREALRSAIPRPASDAADTLLAALHRSRLAESLFGEPGEVKVDRYVIRRELGRGGMGVVFVAEDPLLAVPVALKLLSHGRADTGDRAAESQLQREAQALARVRGDHVVRVYSAGFFMGQPWIAMQLVEGPHLGEWLRARSKLGRPDWREVLARYVEAGRGLQAIHAAGLVHRDFKPQNAVVDADGCVKVLDFGLAAAVSERISADAPRLGTHRYAAPEQFLGRDQGPQGDQFSFCVALYEALAGAPPFGDAVSTGERLATHPTAKPPRPSRELPGWLIAAVQRGLAAKPDERHASMTALLHELTRDRRRNLRIAAVLGVGVLLGVVMALVLNARLGHDARCDTIASDDWDQQRTRLELPAEALARIDHLVIDQRKRLQTTRDELCAATPQPNEATLTLRHACLASTHAKFATALTRGYEKPAQLADSLVNLSTPESCLDLEAGPAGVTHAPPPELVAEVEAQLTEAEVARLYGDHARALVHIDRARQLAGDADDRLTARVLFAYAVTARETGERRAAGAALDRATDLAKPIDPALAVEILHEHVRLDLLTYRTPLDGESDLERASRILEDLDPEDSSQRLAILRAEHRDMRGLLLQEGPDPNAAIEEHSEAIKAWQQLPLRPDIQLRLHESLRSRARAYAAVPDRLAAITDDREALRLAISLHGPDHIAVADLHLALAHDLIGHGELAEAKTEARRASEMLQHRDSGGAARSRCELATLTRDLGDPITAEAEARIAVDLTAADPEADPYERADCDHLLATLAFRNQSMDVEARLEHAIESLAGVQGSLAACDRIYLKTILGLQLIRSNKPQRAEEFVRNDPPPSCSIRSLVLWVRAQIAAQRGDIDGAAEQFLKAIDEPSEHHATQQLELARLLQQHKPGDPRIRQLATAAAPELARQNYPEAAAEAAKLAE